MIARSGVRVLVLADTDSYVKWGACLLDPAPSGWTVDVAVLEGHAAPSTRQVEDALTGTAVDPAAVRRTSGRGLVPLVQELAPDVVVLAVRGHAVPAVTRLLARLGTRPVTVTGVAGISVPVQWYDVNLRRGADLYVVHSRREARELSAVAARHDVDHRVALATLPFLRVAARSPAGSGRRHRGGDAGPVVFAPQSLVPADDIGRRRLLADLTAAIGGARDLHVKVRSRTGEAEAHRGAGDYSGLIGGLPSRQRDRVHVVDGPMSRHLETAHGFVTVGSSAALESVAAGVPAIVLSDLGVGDATFNGVFVGSGLLGTLEDLAADRFRRVDPAWAADNYFHPDEEDTWLDELVDLLDQRAVGALAAPTPLPRTLGNLVRGVYYRLDALAPWRGTPFAPLERLILSTARGLNRTLLHLR